MVKKFSFLLVLTILLSGSLLAQPVGYYNGTAGLEGEELKTKLNEIIDDHVDFSYSQAKYIINYSDADPNNENNVILFYTQRSQNADTYGTEDNDINREHVWAKSHGNFADIRPMDGDAFNLRPADASVNVNRSNKDFGNVQPNGTQHDEATECWFTGDFWEPGPSTKGQVARIILYMSTRYEGKNGELDLEAVNGKDTYPRAEHGDLAALLEWNRQYPPTDFERRRNDRIFTIQQNRNPFIDHPEWADIIWADSTAGEIQLEDFSLSPQFPKAGEFATLSFSSSNADQVTVYWGKSYNSETYTFGIGTGYNNHDITISLEEFDEEDICYIKVIGTKGETTTTEHFSFSIPKNISANDLTSIAEIQGTGNESPMLNQTVTFAGRVVANFDNNFYLQSSSDPNSGVCVYGALKTGYLGDSLVVTGKVTEYSNLTEITNVSYLYNYGGKQQVDPVVLTVDEIDEAYEGMLVTFKNVVFASAGAEVPDENTSYTFTDDTGSATVYFRYGSRMLGKKIPYGITDVTGILSQYQNTYQLLPRSINDFSAGQDTIPPQVAAVTAIDKAWFTVDFDERVELTSSETLSNYSFNNNITALSAYRYPEGKTVILNLEGMTNGTHMVTIGNITDEAGNMMEETSIEFDWIQDSLEELMAAGVSIYPNPVTSGIFTVKSEKELHAVKIFNASGARVAEYTVQGKNVEIYTETAKGNYILQLEFANGTAVQSKLIIK